MESALELTWVDLLAFFLFLGLVIAISLYASRREETGEEYFLAGRNLGWWLIGFSLIASNISTEQFVGMSGGGVADAGLAIASYEWIAAVSLVLVAIFLLPTFLKLGIFTMPQFLEHRFGPGPRTLMAGYMLVVYVVILMVSWLYAASLLFEELMSVPFYASVWGIGLVAGGYTIYGGLKAVVWSDLLQGAALLIGGTVVAVIALDKVGGVEAFYEANRQRLHLFRSFDSKVLPWTAMLVGIWIPNLYYWGLNQFITQRSLGARSLAQGQRGAVFAAFLKILMPFIIVFPGMMAFQLYPDQIGEADQAYPVLLAELLPGWGLRGIIFAALFGAVMSSLDSILNSTSTIFTVDIYQRYVRPDASPQRLVAVGRLTAAVAVLLACLLAPLPGRFSGVFHYIQQSQGFISPGILAAFLFGFLVRRAPSSAAMTGMLLSVPVYGVLFALGELGKLPDGLMSFLNHMAITFVVVVVVMATITVARPLPEPYRFDRRSDIDTTPSRLAIAGGVVAIAIIGGLYVFFR